VSAHLVVPALPRVGPDLVDVMDAELVEIEVGQRQELPGSPGAVADGRILHHADLDEVAGLQLVHDVDLRPENFERRVAHVDDQLPPAGIEERRELPQIPAQRPQVLPDPPRSSSLVQRNFVRATVHLRGTKDTDGNRVGA